MNPSLEQPWFRRVLPWLLLAGVCVLVYARGMDGPLIFDDPGSISENPHIRELWPPHYLWRSPPQSSVSGRPLVSLTLAVNYALGGAAPRGYHVVNLLLHIGCVVAFYHLLALTLRLSCSFRGAGEAAALPAGGVESASGPDRSARRFALAAALVWAVHPLNSETVLYIIQRTELLVSLCYLLTLWLAAVGIQQQRRGLQIAAVLVCFAGMACKEVMASAPLAVLLYDRTFLTGPGGSFAQVLRERWRLYAGLASSWILLAALILLDPRDASTGLGHAVSPWQYLLMQAGVLVHYLRLALVGAPLTISYQDWPIERSLADVLPQGLLILLLLAVTMRAVMRKAPTGFAMACFFMVLAPTSSVWPIITEPAAERRMYLPLAALLAVVVPAVGQWLRRAVPRAWPGSAIAAVSIAAMVYGGMTVLRAGDYETTLSIWADAVDKRPANAEARNNLALALVEHGRPEEAIRQLEIAVRLDPGAENPRYNLGTLLAQHGQAAAAIEHLQKALALRPRDSRRHNNLALAYVQLGQLNLARQHFEQALVLDPGFAEAKRNLQLLPAAVAEPRGARHAAPAAGSGGAGDE